MARCKFYMMMMMMIQYSRHNF